LKNILLVLCFFACLRANAGTLADTVKKERTAKPDTIKLTGLIIPAALITYGALSFAVHPIRRFDYYLHDEIAKSDPNFHTNAETYFLFTPIVLVYGLNLAGVEGKNNFIDRTALLALSGGIAGVSDFSLKHLISRQDPGHAGYSSFPSGHTIGAFASAEFLSQEYSDKSIIYPIIGYTIATTTGVFRMYNRDHWFSDVAAGAGIGMLSTKAAYWVYPCLRKWLTHTDKTGRSTFIMPTYQDGMAGLAFAKEF
jgi:membrane-associated phospholipid phosphatase